MSVRDLLAKIAQETKPEKCGFMYEEMVRYYLLHDRKRGAKNVYTWEEFSKVSQQRGRYVGGQDTGVDLVVEHENGDRTAVQCKHYQNKIKKTDVDSFLANSADTSLYSNAIIASVGGYDDYDGRLKQYIADRNSGPKNVKIQCIGYHNLYEDQDAINWSNFSFDRGKQKSGKVAPQEIRSHQKHAVVNVLSGFLETNKGKLIMACGTGKTLTCMRAVEQYFRLNVHACNVLKKYAQENVDGESLFYGKEDVAVSAYNDVIAEVGGGGGLWWRKRFGDCPLNLVAPPDTQLLGG